MRFASAGCAEAEAAAPGARSGEAGWFGPASGGLTPTGKQKTGVPSIETYPSGWRHRTNSPTDWLAAHALSCSRDLHLTMATFLLTARLSLSCVVCMVKPQRTALRAAYFALRGHHVHYAARENTTITAMASFMHRLRHPPGLRAAVSVRQGTLGRTRR